MRVQGGGENVLYGLVLQNASPNGNALNVGVLVNFVMPDNHLIGSASAQIPIINAASQYDLGGEISFGGAPTISRLEVVIDPGGRAKSAKNFSPALDNVHLVPNAFDPQWLGSVEGDEINIHPTLTLQSSNMSCVVFDAQGNVLGGSAAATSSSFPGRARSSRSPEASTRFRSTRRRRWRSRSSRSTSSPPRRSQGPRIGRAGAR